MIDLIKRKQIMQAIYAYYKGKVYNYEFDDLITVESKDILITTLNQEILYNTFDDTIKHLWPNFYSEKLRRQISLWLSLLNSNFDFSCYSKNYLIDLLLKSNTYFSHKGINYAVNQFFPPVTYDLLTKQSELLPSFWLIKSYLQKKYIKKLLTIIESRNENDLQQSINKRFIYKNSMNYGIYSIDRIKRMQPTDDILFAIKDENQIFKYYKTRNAKKITWSDCGTWDELKITSEKLRTCGLSGNNLFADGD